MSFLGPRKYDRHYANKHCSKTIYVVNVKNEQNEFQKSTFLRDIGYICVPMHIIKLNVTNDICASHIFISTILN